jgi:cyclopropane fatty-acyl-phospholipid synthase-like methyltransferase
MDKPRNKISNVDSDWAKHYDYYTAENREKYLTYAKSQNESHYEMLKSKGRKFLKKEHTFCEIGFGSGITLRYALKHFGKVYGLDISPKNVELMEHELKTEGYSDFELYVCDLTKYDERFENKFDVISFIHGLEHFSSEDYPIIFDNIKKYLKPNGVFTGALPFKLNFNYRMCPHCHQIFEVDGHISIHDNYSLNKVFEENGFEIIHLDNFNLQYALKHGSFISKMYKFISFYLLKKRSDHQLEYIVVPKAYNN